MRISHPQRFFVGDLVRIVIFLYVCFAPTTTLAIQLTNNQNDTDCVDLRLIIVFEDRPIDVTINLHTASKQPQLYYWENYVPYSRKNVSTTSLLEEICVPRNECYILQVVDNAKIGWSANETPTSTSTNSSRAFSISFDQNIIGIYDSRVVNSCFSVQWYQFGYSCHDETAEDGDVIDNITESSIISIYRGSLPCPTSAENQTNLNNTNTTGTPNISDADETILKGSNVTLSFSGTDISAEPTSAPTDELNPSETPSVSSAPSKIPAISKLPSLVPTEIATSSKSPIVAEIDPAILIPADFESDMPSTLLSSSTVPSDAPSSFPSMVPTAKCIDFFVIVKLDEHPEDMVLTLTSTHEHGSDDDVVIWDRIRPWNGENGTNITYTVHQMVNQTTCIYEDECYTFIVEDMAQDGLVSAEQNSSTSIDNTDTSETDFVANVEIPRLGGYFMLSYDTDRIISYYDGNVDGCYRKKIYKFGLSSDCVMTETTEPSDRSCPQVRRRR